MLAKYHEFYRNLLNYKISILNMIYIRILRSNLVEKQMCHFCWFEV